MTSVTDGQLDLGAAAPPSEAPFQVGQWAWRAFDVGKGQIGVAVLLVENCVYDWPHQEWIVIGHPVSSQASHRSTPARHLTLACGPSCKGPTCTSSPHSTDPAPAAATPAPTFPTVSEPSADAKSGASPEPPTSAAPPAIAPGTLVPVTDYYAGIIRPPEPDRYCATCPDCHAAVGQPCLFNRRRGTAMHKNRLWARARAKDTLYREWLARMRAAWLDRCFDEGVHFDVMNAALRNEWHAAAGSRLQITWARDRWLKRYGAKAYRGKGRTAPPIPQIVLDHFSSWTNPYQDVGPTVQ